jgi:hypothetical protein
VLTIIIASIALSAATSPAAAVVKSDIANRTPAEIEALRTDTDGLTVVTLPNGTKMMDLKGRFQMEMRATVGADGKVVMQCDNETAGHDHSAETLVVDTNKPDER